MKYANLIEASEKFLARVHNADRDRIIAPAEKKIARDFRVIFSKQKRIVLAEFAKMQKHFSEAVGDDADKLFNAAEKATKEDMLVAIKGGCEPVVKAASKSFVETYATGFELANPLAVEYLEANAAEMVTAINNVTRNQVAAIVTNAVDRGWSYNKTGKLLRETFDGFTKYRAQLIATNEARSAYEYANLETGRYLQDEGLEMEKKWSNTGDSKVTDGCRDNAAEGWIPLEQEFKSNDLTSPRFPGCRCSILYRRKGAGKKRRTT